jgi:prepilin-type N-terminal cleavage/methylation domain-containing protein
MTRRNQSRGGFTLLEVMMAVAIMAIALGAVFSAQAGSVKMAQRARKLGFATLLVRCKMGELEEEVAKKGLPASLFTGTDTCCKDAPIEGFKCKWELAPIVLPDSMFNADDDKEKDKKPGAAGSSLASGTGTGAAKKGGLAGLLGAASAVLGGGKTDGTDLTKDPKDKTDPKDPNKKLDPKDLLKDPSQLLSGTGNSDNDKDNGPGMDGLTAMAMQYVYPLLKPAFQSQIRRATVTIEWQEGSAERKFDVTQYIVAEQPVPLSTDPNNPNATPGAGTGTGGGAFGSATSTGVGK